MLAHPLLLDASGIASLPGEAYGLPCYFRLTFANPTVVLERAARLIREACDQLR